MKQHLELAQAQLADLNTVHQFIDSFAQAQHLDESIVFALRLAIEEVFVNLIQHGYKNQPGFIGITLETNDSQVIATIHDFSPPFPPESAPRPNLTQDWRDRPLGGLGWHFIRAMMDEIHYASDPKTGNILTLIKWLK